jgi:hypothetical protein
VLVCVVGLGFESGPFVVFCWHKSFASISKKICHLFLFLVSNRLQNPLIGHVNMLAAGF